MMNHSPHRIAFSWIQQAHHLPRLKNWFINNNIDIYSFLKNLNINDSYDTEIIQHLINNLKYEIITIPWQMISVLDNLGDRTIYKLDNVNSVYAYILNKDKIENRKRNYNFDKFVESILNNTVDTPSILLENNFYKPRFNVIDGRTRLALAWIYKHNIPCAVYRL